MTTIIRAGAAHDFLALVPVLAGYVPERSLICVAFEGNRTSGVLRYDLPSAEEEMSEVVAASALGAICRMPRVDGIAVIAYGERTFGEGDLPHRALLGRVVRLAEEAGFQVRDALSVAPDGWGSCFDPELPVGGRDLRLIAESRAGAEARGLRTIGDSAAGSIRIRDADDALAVPIGSILEGLAKERSCRARDASCEGHDAASRIVRQLDDAVEPSVLVERLASGRSDRTPEELAWLLDLAEDPAIRDAMMLQAAFGPLIGELAIDVAEDAADRSGVSPTVVDGVPDDSEETVDAFLARLMLGRSSVRPDVGRVEAMLDVLVIAASNAPAGRRAGALCITAWLAWALGRGSAAGALVDLAVSESPDHVMAGLLRRFLGSGALPDWAFSPTGPRSEPERDGGNASGPDGR